MARVGRPAERPSHLTPEQRRRAQGKTAEWRGLVRRSQRDMASLLSVSESTYRTWETGSAANSGPTHEQARLLDQALSRLLAERYIPGQALAIWGWPAEHEISFARLAEIWQAAGLVTQHPQAASPTAVLWVQRLREPNLVHGVLCLAAAAATRAGLAVRLLLDDGNLSSGTRKALRDEFDFRLAEWFAFADGNKAMLTVSAYSEILTDRLLEQKGWAAVLSYLTAKSSVLEILLASKTVSPLQYDTSADQGVLELVRQAEGLKADRLITPIRNWIVFDHEIALLATENAGGRASIVTLGGEDERVLWELWHRGCADRLSEAVQHAYLRPIPMPNYRVPWQEMALTVRTSRRALANYLRTRVAEDGNADVPEWMTRAAVGLPAILNPDYRSGLPEALISREANLALSSEQLTALIPAVAEAVVTWLTPDRRSGTQ